jgi:hypothetical protein
LERKIDSSAQIQLLQQDGEAKWRFLDSKIDKGVVYNRLDKGKKEIASNDEYIFGNHD